MLKCVCVYVNEIQNWIRTSSHVMCTELWYGVMSSFSPRTHFPIQQVFLSLVTVFIIVMMINNNNLIGNIHVAQKRTCTQYYNTMKMLSRGPPQPVRACWRAMEFVSHVLSWLARLTQQWWPCGPICEKNWNIWISKSTHIYTLIHKGFYIMMSIHFILS